ncbi:hypothetical protein BDN67DRAFT_935052, partial [Paxillus ammoniavirescens]
CRIGCRRYQTVPRFKVSTDIYTYLYENRDDPTRSLSTFDFFSLASSTLNVSPISCRCIPIGLFCVLTVLLFFSLSPSKPCSLEPILAKSHPLNDPSTAESRPEPCLYPCLYGEPPPGQTRFLGYPSLSRSSHSLPSQCTRSRSIAPPLPESYVRVAHPGFTSL